MAVKKVKRARISTPVKTAIRKAYKTEKDLDKLVAKFKISKSSIGRIVGYYKPTVVSPEKKAQYERTRKMRKINGDTGLAKLHSYLDGVREGMLVRVASTEENAEDSKYINGWDDCAKTILDKIGEFI